MRPSGFPSKSKIGFGILHTILFLLPLLAGLWFLFQMKRNWDKKIQLVIGIILAISAIVVIIVSIPQLEAMITNHQEQTPPEQIPQTNKTQPQKFHGMTIINSDLSHNGKGGIMDNGVPLNIIKSKINSNNGSGIEANNVPSLNINGTQISNNTGKAVVVNNKTVIP